MTASAIAATLVLLLLAVAAAFARGRPGRPRPGDLPAVAGRAALSRDAGVAVVRVRGQVILVGWGRSGVRMLARLGPERPE